MKTRLVIFGAVLMLILSFIIYNYKVKYNFKEKIANKNLDNIKKIKIGMDTTEVLGIMGDPIDKRRYKSELFYDYGMPSGTSIQCQIIFDSLGQVIFISPSAESLN
ncbi:hypothetical protein KUV23_12325 [Algoriphagus marincola]|uniref:SmpA / OmlA family protein n=1 Tax=Algoriphagus marincola TaxID=264027 RepID=A0ABS7N5Z7_9BACT|nr:hypothetical protein [Algoriphagus marincola]MBY5951766.1 hypothetical protein [Algoriphagus marincola]